MLGRERTPLIECDRRSAGRSRLSRCESAQAEVEVEVGQIGGAERRRPARETGEINHRADQPRRGAGRCSWTLLGHIRRLPLAYRHTTHTHGDTHSSTDRHAVDAGGRLGRRRLKVPA